MDDSPPKLPDRRGRGAGFYPANRCSTTETVPVEDGWGSGIAEPEPLRTTLTVDATRSIIARNDSPDVPFDRSINPYRGCEHGCIYCYARPSHAWLGLSPGLDFESRLFYKPDAAALLRKELGARNYCAAPIALGANTDAWQPVEREQRITRGILEVLAETRHPVTIVTKSALVERDIDLLGAMAADGLASVMVSVTTLDPELARRLEPRATAPQRRLQTLRVLADAGIPTGVMVAPVIPGLTDAGIERILGAAKAAGATAAGYVLLRLPYEVAPLFRDWLDRHYPEKARRVMGIVQATRGGQANDARFGSRMTGQGAFAELVARRFALARRRLSLTDPVELNCDLFRAPANDTSQMTLF